MLNLIFLIYFATHIPITILIDSQAIFPATYYPQQLRDLIQYHVQQFHDPLMHNPPVWFQSFIIIELIVQLPFFFIATHAFMKGITKCKWMKWPSIAYAAHVMTTVIPTMAHIAFTDFSESEVGPKNQSERYTLLSLYFPYFLIPLILLIYMSVIRFDVAKPKVKKG